MSALYVILPIVAAVVLVMIRLDRAVSESIDQHWEDRRKERAVRMLKDMVDSEHRHEMRMRDIGLCPDGTPLPGREVFVNGPYGIVGPYNSDNWPTAEELVAAKD